jgi:hypothetical protein
MSEETAREIAEREIGRPDENEKRKTPERRSYRSGSGRRGDKSSKNRNGSQKPAGSTDSVDQRKFNRG